MDKSTIHHHVIGLAADRYSRRRVAAIRRDRRADWRCLVHAGIGSGANRALVRVAVGKGNENGGPFNGRSDQSIDRQPGLVAIGVNMLKDVSYYFSLYFSRVIIKAPLSDEAEVFQLDQNLVRGVVR